MKELEQAIERALDDLQDRLRGSTSMAAASCAIEPEDEEKFKAQVRATSRGVEAAQNHFSLALQLIEITEGDLTALQKLIEKGKQK